MEFLQFLEPWMIPIVIMVCVTLIVIVTSVTKIITTSISKKEGKSISENKEFLNALREFKENIDQRVTHLEDAVIAERKKAASQKSGKENPKIQSAIELELDDEKPREQETSESSKLRNMLNQ
ncbi:MAG: hypothetical protein R3220_07395 [Balneolaceae bacterium]|nr:hypothetical protein [Balneolaceae bacterium]